jgi:hypothetical protein
VEPKRKMRPLEKGVFFFLLAGGLAGLLFMFYLNAKVDDWNVDQKPAVKALSLAVGERAFVCVIRPTPS